MHIVSVDAAVTGICMDQSNGKISADRWVFVQLCHSSK